MLYINSPGGVVTAGLAIYDTMQYVRCDVATICMGQAASMGGVAARGRRQGQALRAAARAHHDPPAARRLPGPGDRHRHPRQGDPEDARHAQRAAREAHRPADQQDQARHRARLLHVGRPRPKNTASIDEVLITEKKEADEEKADREVERARTPSDSQRDSRRQSDVLLLRQVAEGGEEADRRPDRLHLRRVHRAVQRHHRRGDREGRAVRTAAPPIPKPARDQDGPRRVRDRPGAREEDPRGRGAQPLQAHRLTSVGIGRRRAAEVEHPAARARPAPARRCSRRRSRAS